MSDAPFRDYANDPDSTTGGFLSMVTVSAIGRGPDALIRVDAGTSSATHVIAGQDLQRLLRWLDNELEEKF